MRRSFLLTVVSGVLVTLVGCGGEVATETADTSSSPPSSSSTATPSSSPRPQSGPGGGGGSGAVPLPGDPTGVEVGPGGSSTTSSRPQSGPGGPGGTSGPPAGMSVLTGPGGQTGSGGAAGFPASGPGGQQSGPGGPQSGPGGPQGGSGGVNYPPGGYPGGTSGPQSGPGGPQSGPGGPGFPGSGAPLPGNPTSVQVGAGGGATSGENSGGTPQSGPGGQEQGGGASTASVGEGIPFGPGGPPPGFGSGPGGSGPGGPTGPMSYPPGYPGGPGGPNQAQAPAIPEPKNLKEKSELAFQRGRDEDGFQYMYAWFVADPDGEGDNDLRLFTPTNLPHSALRIGVAIEYEVSGNLKGAPPTIGSQPNVTPGEGNNRNGGRSGPTGEGAALGGGAPTTSSLSPPGFGGNGGGGGEEPSDPLGQYQYYTGELGEKLVAELQDLRTSRDAPFGTFLKDISVDWPRQPATSNRTMGFPGGSSGPGGAGFNPMGVQVGAGGGQTFQGPGNGQNAPAGGGSAIPRDPESDQLIPGIVWLGKGRKTSLIEDAKDAGLDILILYDTAISVVASTGLERNVTTVYMFNVNAEDNKDLVIAKTRPLNSVTVWTESQRGREPIETGIEQLFELAEQKGFGLTDLPALEAEQAKARVDSIVSSVPDEILPALAEIKYFHKESLINDADLISAYESILGDADKAETLATGTAEEREAILQEWLPEEAE